jgi:hypothetical protein
MGTRGAWGFRVEGRDKVTYNHWDSYPTGLGLQVMKFVHALSTPELEAIGKKIILVDEKGKPTAAQIKQYLPVADTGVGEQKLTDWYCLLRGLQFHPENYRVKTIKHMIDSHTFLGESLWCEWAYIINIESGKLEFYEGGNVEDIRNGRESVVNKNGRYWNLGRYQAGSGALYYGVGLIAEFGLSEIRAMNEEQMTAKCKELERADEED